jgi:DNA-binding transcriptional LysR family regulator
MQTFIRIAELGSMSAVAKEQGTSQPTISKQLAALEERLGVALLQRTTRSLSLTEAGASYYEAARRILDEVETLEGNVGQLSRSPAGTLVITAPNALGQLYLDAQIIAFQQLYPSLTVHLQQNDRFVDLVEEGVDVGIRVGPLDDSSLVARKLGVSRRVTAASPEYLARHGEPKTPQDLKNHNCILYSYLATGSEWHFRSTKGEMKVRVQGTLRTNSAFAIQRALLAHIGIGAPPIWSVKEDLRAGRLVPILTDYAQIPADIHAVYPSSRHVTTKVRLFVDFLKDAFAQVPELN